MPRDGSNIYHVPPGTQGIPDTTVASAPYNSFLADIEADQNTPRPIIAGGTGANSADAALLALSGEKAKQVITNFDGAWLPGSFYAATTATASPVAGHAFAGIAYYANATDLVVEARDLTDPAHLDYVRVMSGGVWGAWAVDGASSLAAYLPLIGGTLTGNLTVSKADPTVSLNKPASGTAAAVAGMMAGAARWVMQLGNNTAEAAGNVGSDFALSRYDNAGVVIDTPLAIARSTGLLTLKGDPTAPLGAATKQYVDAGDAAIAAGANGAVRWDIAQAALTEAQRVQARQNVYAAPFDAMGYYGMQYNGSMDIWQNSTIGTVSSGWLNFSGYALDGWISSVFQATPGATAFSAISVPSGGSLGNSIKNSMGLQATVAAPLAAATDRVVLSHPIEGTRFARLNFGTANAQPVTIAFWVWAAVTGTFTVGLGSHGTAQRIYLQEVAVPVAAVWQYVVLTFPPDVTVPANWVSDTGRGCSLMFCFGGGATTKGGAPNVWANWSTQYATAALTNFFATNNNSVYITGLGVFPGVEAPSAARSPLIQRSADQEQRLCERYFQVYRLMMDYTGYGNAAQFAFTDRILTTTMRTGPSVAFSNISHNNTSGLAVNASTINHLRTQFIVSIAGYAYVTFDMQLDARM